MELVKQHPELRAWQLVELKKKSVVAEAEKPKAEEKTEAVAAVESKTETLKVEEPIKKAEEIFVKEITDDDINGSHVSVPKKESVVEKPKSVIKEEPKPTLNKLDEKEPDHHLKQNILQELIEVAGAENDYVEYVRNNYKKGVADCLNHWFETHN